MVEENYIDQFPQVKEAVDAILNIKDEFVGKISEEIFVKRFLPLLAQSENPVDLTEWNKIAGHAYNEVDVIKDGKVLFRVPAILRRLNTKKHKHASKSVYEIMETSRLNSVNSPLLGDQILEKGLQETLSETEINLSDAERWDAILIRYGYKKTSDVAISGTNTASSFVDDEIDFGAFEPA